MSRSAARQLPGLALATLIGVCPCASPQSAAQTPDAAIVQGALQPRIVPPPATYRFPNGKKFVYAVEWHLVTAGTATIQFDPDGGEEKLTATAATSGAVNFIYPVHSWFEARIDARTFCSKRIFKHSEEGKRK
jgi:hypothetical protein